jgi:phosphopantetheine--protein transferase-like protein
MIYGIGTDLVNVNRFAHWDNYSRTRMGKIFSEQEILDCFQDDNLWVQRLATRFAAKEAFYKALSAALFKIYPDCPKIYFLFICRYVSVTYSKYTVPCLQVDWGEIEKKIGRGVPVFNVHVSLAHEKNQALAFVILSKGSDE